MTANKMVFIKNIVDVKVDGLRGLNHYKITAMYDEIHEDGHASIKQIVVDEFDYTWSEIEREGGIAQFNKNMKECYGTA